MNIVVVIYTLPRSCVMAVYFSLQPDVYFIRLCSIICLTQIIH